MSQYKEHPQINGVVMAPINSNKTTLASAGIAKFISTYFKIPLIDLNSPEKTNLKHSYEYVFLVNANFGFSKDSTFMDKAIRHLNRAKYPIYVNNDYVLTPPGQIMKAFRPRKFIWWTTVPDIKGINIKKSIYVNWNKLTYDPHFAKDRKIKYDKFIYWGAFRKKRADYFKRYLNHSDVTISTTKRAKENFRHSCPDAKILEPFPNLQKSLCKYKATIYLEDNTGGHRRYCSPANRFYEALGCGLPMLFQPESYSNFKRAGYDIKPFIVNDRKQMLERLSKADKIAKEQASWRKDYLLQLVHEMDNALAETK